jgi:hypothetical protein
VKFSEKHAEEFLDDNTGLYHQIIPIDDVGDYGNAPCHPGDVMHNAIKAGRCPDGTC